MGKGASLYKQEGQGCLMETYVNVLQEWGMTGGSGGGKALNKTRSEV